MCQPGFMRNESPSGTNSPSPTASTAEIKRTAPCAVFADGEAAERSAAPPGLATAVAAISRARKSVFDITTHVSGGLAGLAARPTVIWVRRGPAGKANEFTHFRGNRRSPKDFPFTAART